MPDATVTILVDEPLGTISPLLHGHFAEHLGRCCNDGLWVGPATGPRGRDIDTPTLGSLKL